MSDGSARAAVAAPERWLFGRLPDLLLGCGLLYALLFVAFLVAGPDLRVAQPYFVFPVLVLVFSTPHYGATLLRVYEQRRDRAAYAFVAVWATCAVAVWFTGAVYVPLLASWMVTLYFTWSPWHYTGQNYGLALMFLRRRGVAVTPGIKRCVHASFTLSYALVFTMMHAGSGGSVDRPLASYAGGAAFYSLGIPRELVAVLAPLLVAAYAGAALTAAVLLLRRATLRDLAPTALLMLTQALWFSLPFALHHFQLLAGVDPLSWQFRTHYLSWIVAGHAIQYLWVTTYYARSSDGFHGYSPYFAKILVAGLATWTLPAVLFAPALLGGPAYHAGLAVLIAAAVNIHHFILDGAIWKLRQQRVASVLIRSGTGATTSPAAAVSAGWTRRLVWSGATLGTLLGLFFFWVETVTFPRAVAQQEYAEARRAQRSLSWFGRSNFIHVQQLNRAERAQAARGGEARGKP